MKKYSNNIFLDNLNNDISRTAYSLKKNTTDKPKFDKDIVINREMDTNLFIKQKDMFDSNNSTTNSLLEEIQSLKKKLQLVYEKDEEIQILRNDLQKYKSNSTEITTMHHEISSLKLYISTLKDESDKLKINLSNYEKIKTENIFLKTQIQTIRSSKSSKSNPDSNSIDTIDTIDTIDAIDTIDTIDAIDATDNTTSDIHINTIDIHDNDNEMIIDIDNLKNILCNRLKDFHETHINNLLINYKINNNEPVDKNIIKNLLEEAIHP